MSEFKAPDTNLGNKLLNNQQKETKENENIGKREFPPLNYQLPEWSGKSDSRTYFEVIKQGVKLEDIQLNNKAVVVIGRLPICDIELEHHSISRYHALIQFNTKGEAFLFDIGSTHGTRLNKQRIEANNYIPLKDEDQIKFGESTRLFIFKSLSHQIKVKAYQEETKEPEVTWGFAEDAVEEEDLEALMEDEEYKIDEDAYFYKDPKKALRNFLENQGCAVEYVIKEEGDKHDKEYTAKINLPIPGLDDLAGDSLYGVGTSTKKREAERLAALDACEKLDKLKMLRSSGIGITDLKKQRLKRLLKENEDDEFDSYYDRTDYAEKSKIRKNQRKMENKIETFDSLNIKKQEIENAIQKLNNQIQDKNNIIAKIQKEVDDYKMKDNDIDAYMAETKLTENKKNIQMFEVEIRQLNLELKKVNKLIEIVAPHSLTDSKSKQTLSNTIDDNFKENQIEKVENPAPSIPLPDESVQSDSKANSKVTNEIRPIVSIEFEKNQSITTINNEEINEANDNTIPYLNNTSKENEQVDKEEEEKDQVNDNATWAPPQGQTGDGKTSLNDKYGY